MWYNTHLLWHSTYIYIVSFCQSNSNRCASVHQCQNAHLCGATARAHAFICINSSSARNNVNIMCIIEYYGIFKWYIYEYMHFSSCQYRMHVHTAIKLSSFSNVLHIFRKSVYVRQLNGAARFRPFAYITIYDAFPGVHLFEYVHILCLGANLCSRAHTQTKKRSFFINILCYIYGICAILHTYFFCI